MQDRRKKVREFVATLDKVSGATPMLADCLGMLRAEAWFRAGCAVARDLVLIEARRLFGGELDVQVLAEDFGTEYVRAGLHGPRVDAERHVLAGRYLVDAAET